MHTNSVNMSNVGNTKTKCTLSALMKVRDGSRKAGINQSHIHKISMVTTVFEGSYTAI